jgi:hypothetical protein
VYRYAIIIVSTMIEYATAKRTVAVVRTLTIGIIHQQANNIFAESAVNKYIITTIVDATIIATSAIYIGKSVEFA